MNAAERIRFRVAQLNDKIDGGKADTPMRVFVDGVEVPKAITVDVSKGDVECYDAEGSDGGNEVPVKTISGKVTVETA